MRRQRGFTLVELLAVMAIIGILAGVVAGSVSGLGASGLNAQIASDTNTLEKSADRFFNDSFPQTYPVVDPDTNKDDELDALDSPPLPAGDVDVRLIDFDARLPQDPTKTFAPDFIKDIPNSAALVSYRVVTTTGTVFAAADGAALIPPANSRLDVTVANISTGIPSAVTFDLTMSTNRAAVEILKTQIPAGYIIGGQSLSAGVEVGKLDILFYVDNPWKPGHQLKVSAPILATGRANKWEVSPNYATAKSESSGDIIDTVRGAIQADGITRGPGPTLTHKLEISQATTETPGTLTLLMDREGPAVGPAPADVPHNESRETWALTIFDYPKNGPQPDALVTNPTQAAVYRWVSQEHTTIQVEDVFEPVAGKQVVLIKEGTDGDKLRPVVSAITPSNHATDVPVTTDIIVTFSEAIDVDTVFDATNASSTFALSSGSGAVAGSFSVSANHKNVTFDPTSALEEGTFYSVTLTSGITDDDGNTLVPVTSTFTTADTTAPAVVSVVPIDGGLAPVDTLVVLAFTELVTNVNGSTFTVRNGSTSVTGNITLDGLLATFTPAEDLTINTAYDVTVSTGVQDLSGNTLDQEFTSTFTTAAQVAGLVGWWTGELNANANAVDIVGGNNGALFGGTVVAGKIGQAFSFDGVDDYVTIPSNVNLDFGTGDFSVDAWIQIENSAPARSNRIANRLETNHGWAMDIAWNGVGACTARGPGEENTDSIAGTTNLKDGVFHHVACVREGSVLKLFVDGVSEGEVSGRTGDVNVSVNLWIGARRIGPDLFFKGLIDEVTVYNRALNAAEVQSIFDADSAGKVRPS